MVGISWKFVRHGIIFNLQVEEILHGNWYYFFNFFSFFFFLFKCLTCRFVLQASFSITFWNSDNCF
jgi:hypothetical protein